MGWVCDWIFLYLHCTPSCLSLSLHPHTRISLFPNSSLSTGSCFNTPEEKKKTKTKLQLLGTSGVCAPAVSPPCWEGSAQSSCWDTSGEGEQQEKAEPGAKQLPRDPPAAPGHPLNPAEPQKARTASSNSQLGSCQERLQKAGRGQGWCCRLLKTSHSFLRTTGQ